MKFFYSFSFCFYCLFKQIKQKHLVVLSTLLFLGPFMRNFIYGNFKEWRNCSHVLNRWGSCEHANNAYKTVFQCNSMHLQYAISMLRCFGMSAEGKISAYQTFFQNEPPKEGEWRVKTNHDLEIFLLQSHSRFLS